MAGAAGVCFPSNVVLKRQVALRTCSGKPPHRARMGNDDMWIGLGSLCGVGAGGSDSLVLLSPSAQAGELRPGFTLRGDFPMRRTGTRWDCVLNSDDFTIPAIFGVQNLTRETETRRCHAQNAQTAQNAQHAQTARTGRALPKSTASKESEQSDGRKGCYLASLGAVVIRTARQLPAVNIGEDSSPGSIGAAVCLSSKLCLGNRSIMGFIDKIKATASAQLQEPDQFRPPNEDEQGLALTADWTEEEEHKVKRK